MPGAKYLTRVLLIGSLLACVCLAHHSANAELSHSVLDLYELTVDVGGDYDRLGGSVALDGNSAVAGASNANAAYVFQRQPDGTWIEADRLSPGDTAEPIRFGWTTDISGDTLAVGADLTKIVYIFQRESGDALAWSEVKQLETGGGPEDGNGLDVAVAGDTLVIGYPNAPASCCVYIHQRDSGGANNWGRVRTLSTADPGAHSFGGAVAISGDWIAATAEDADQRIVVYLFRRDFGGPGNWGQFQKLILDDDGGEEDVFEAHELLAMSGNTLLVGSYDATVPSSSGITRGQGVATIFQRQTASPGQWTRVKKLVASDGHENQWFGYSVAVSGDKALIGAVWADSEGADKQGAAYIFQRDAGGAGHWGEVERLTSASGAAREYFGASVACDFQADFIGAPGASYEGGESQGKLFYTIRFVADHQLWVPWLQKE